MFYFSYQRLDQLHFTFSLTIFNKNIFVKVKIKSNRIWDVDRYWKKKKDGWGILGWFFRNPAYNQGRLEEFAQGSV